MPRGCVKSQLRRLSDAELSIESELTMTSFAATAVLTPSATQVTWPGSADVEVVASVTDFLDELRGVAARRPGAQVRALVRDMDGQASFRAGLVTGVEVDAVGSMAFFSADEEAWQAATASSANGTASVSLQSLSAAPVAAAPQVSAPPAVAQVSGIEELFGTRFREDTGQGGFSLLPEIVLATANTKGGAGKTTLAALLVSAATALAGHHDAVLVDINPSGNLAEHTRQSAGGDVLELAEACADPVFGVSPRDLDPFVSWQPAGWAITCPPSIATVDGELVSDLDGQDLSRIMTTLRRAFRLIVLDTGNNAKDEAWQAAMRSAARILVPLQWDPDTLVQAQAMIADMAKVGHHQLRERIVFVGTYGPGARPDRKRERQYRTALETSGWTVMDIPPDRHIAEKGIIVWDKLAKRTRDAATRLAEEVLS